MNPPKLYTFTITCCVSVDFFISIRFGLEHTWFPYRPNLKNLYYKDCQEDDFNNPMHKEIRFEDTIDGASIMDFLLEHYQHKSFKMTINYNPPLPY
jgi:hypothetical protein